VPVQFRFNIRVSSRAISGTEFDPVPEEITAAGDRGYNAVKSYPGQGSDLFGVQAPGDHERFLARPEGGRAGFQRF